MQFSHFLNWLMLITLEGEISWKGDVGIVLEACEIASVSISEFLTFYCYLHSHSELSQLPPPSLSLSLPPLSITIHSTCHMSECKSDVRLY